MKKINVILITSVVIILAACSALSSKEIGRISFTKPLDDLKPEWKKIELSLKQGEILRFWTDMDLEYDGAVDMAYSIKLVKGTDTLVVTDLNPFEKNITMGEVKTTVMGKTKWSFSGQMHTLDIKEGGTYTLMAAFSSSLNTSLKLNKADLVLKK